jgi:hypothetical protein
LLESLKDEPADESELDKLKKIIEELKRTIRIKVNEIERLRNDIDL